MATGKSTAKKAPSGKATSVSALAGGAKKAKGRAAVPRTARAATRPMRGFGVPAARGSLAVADTAPTVFTPHATVERLVAVLGNNALARILGVSASQPTRWRTSKEAISPANRRRLSDLDHVLDRLLLELWPDQAGDWLASPNAHLGGAAPIDVLVLRGAAPVLEAIDALAAGAFA